MDRPNSLIKSQILKSKLAITEIFIKGKTEYSSTLSCRYFVSPKQNASIKFGFSVPKKQVPLAVNRNLIKRRMKEALRINCNNLLATIQANMVNINVMFVYNTKEIAPFAVINEQIKKHLTFLEKNIEHIK